MLCSLRVHPSFKTLGDSPRQFSAFRDIPQVVSTPLSQSSSCAAESRLMPPGMMKITAPCDHTKGWVR